MKRTGISRFIVLVTMFSMLLQSTSAVLAAEATPPVEDGTLVVSLVDGEGTPLGGGCFAVVDSYGHVTELCDEDGDGVVTFTGLPIGPATVRNTAAPAGYELAGEEPAGILEGFVASVTMLAYAVPAEEPVVAEPAEEPVVPQPPAAPVEPEPSEEQAETETAEPEPTVDESEEATEEPAKVDAAPQLRNISPLAIGSPSLACVPLGPNQGADIELFIPASEDDPTPGLTYFAVDRFGNETEHTGTLTWNAARGGFVFSLPGSQEATVDFVIQVAGQEVPIIVGAGCAKFNPLVLGIDTIATDGTNLLPDGTQIPSGTPFGDTARFAGPDVEYISELAGQTVTYRLYKDDPTCSGTPVREISVTIGSDGSIPDSGLVNPADVGGDGIYDWHVVYGGDDHFNPAESICGSETVVVGQVATRVDTVMKRADGTTIAQGATVPVGTTVYDTATLSGATGTASGEVTYALYRGNSCAGTDLVFGPETVPVANGQIPDSPEYTPDALGIYNWVVTYSGDDQNAAAISPCGDETFAVGPAQPTITTAMFEADDTPIPQGGSVTRGTGVYDTAEMTGFYIPEGGVLEGSVVYTLYRGACPGGDVVGTVTLPVGEDGTLPDSNALGDVFTADQAGTYNWLVTYTGDAYNASGISDCGSETFNVTLNPTTITTTPELRTGADSYTPIPINDVVGSPADVRDTAVVGGLSADATGTVTYTLYKGSGCGGAAYAGPFTVDLNEDGTVPPSPVVEGLEPGQYNWVAVYSGDANNEGAAGACGDEQFFVTHGTGTGGYVRTDVVNSVTGEIVPDNARVPLGTSVHDTAQFYGTIVDSNGNAAVDGTLTYSLYAGETCDTTPVDSWSVTVTAGQPVPDMPESFTFINAGTYNFQAVFTTADGDVASLCGTETVIVDPAQPVLTTTIYADGDEVDPQTRLVRPVSVADDVAFTFGNQDLDGVPGPNGTLEYRLYNNAGCSGDPVFTSTKPVVDGAYDLSDAFDLTEENYGVYNWVVTFTSSDGNYLNAVSGCGQETFYLDAQPELTTEMYWSPDGEGEGEVLPNQGELTVGDYIRDTGTLDNFAPGASGTVTFTLHQGGTCEGTAMFSNTVPVTNGVIESTGWYKIRLAGEYSWSATYSGNNIGTGGFNTPAESDCSTETFTVEPADGPATIETVMRSGETVIPHLNYIVRPASVTDVALFTNLSDDANGTVTYTLYASVDCAEGTDVFTSTQNVVNGLAPLSDPYTIPQVSDINGQVYSWVVTFTGTDRGEDVSLTSGCGEEQFRIFDTLEYSATAVCTYNPEDITMSFTVTANPRPVGDTGPGVTVTMQPYNRDLTAAAPITIDDTWVFTYEHEEWRRVEGRAEWDNGSWATFTLRCLQSPYSPELTTTMYQAGTPDVVLEDGGTVAPGTVIYDTTQVVPETSTVIMTGTLTYQLLRGESCDTAVPYGAPHVKDLNDTPIGELPASDPVTINDPGNYWWVVTYTPPATPRVPDNNAAQSLCGAEFFSVDAFDTQVTTLIVTENGSSTAAATGENVHDTAALTFTPAVPTTAVPTGTVTYYAYAGQGADACTGDPVFTSGPLSLNMDGTLPPSETTQFLTPGHYEFQAVYSGDANFNGSTSECGTEPLAISAPTLAIAKEAHNTTINAGEQIGFTVTVTNPGPGIATGVTITDELPAAAGLTWGLDEGNSDATCVMNDGVVTCGPRDLGSGQSIDLYVTGSTTAETCGTITNQASFTTGNGSGEGPSNPATVTIDCPDLEIVKTAAEGTVNATDDIVFDLVIRNTGAGDAFDVVVTDELPDGLTWTIDGGPAAAFCEIDEDGVLTCALGTIASGGETSVSVRATTSYETCGTYTNTASVAASNEKSTATGNNSSTASASVNCSDIEVTKIADDAEVSSGDEIGFTLTVTNSGEGDAYGVTLTDELPVAEGLSWTIDPEVEGCAIEDGVLTCDFGDLAPEATASVHIVSPTTADTCGVIDNSALVSSDNHPDAPASGQVVVNCPNIVVEKAAGSAFISAGEAIGFEITVTNVGAGIARDVVLTDELPEGFAWTINPEVEGCAITDGVLECDFGDIAPEASAIVTITAPTSAEQCGVVENTARASAGNEKDDATGDNESGTSVTILCPDTSILKTTSTPTVSAGEEIGFTIAFTNAGPGKAFDVQITDELPDAAGLDWRLDPTVDGCDIDAGVLDCAFDTVEPETTITLTLVSPTTAQSCGEIENTVSATSSNDDPVTSDAGVTVLCPDLEIEKTADAEEVSAGEAIGFTITLTNNGPGKAFDATLTDTLPDADGLAWTIDPENEACAIEDGVLDCDFGTIDADASVSVHLTSPITGQTCSTVENVASASFSNNETVEGGDTVVVNCPDVAIEKIADDEAVSASERIGFTISFSNAGPGDAFDVVVTDQLPTSAGLAWTIDGGSAAELCEIGEDGVLTCEIGTLEAEAGFDVHISSQTTAETCSVVENTASVAASNEAETTLANNTSSARVRVDCSGIVLTKTADAASVMAGEQIGFTIAITNNGDGAAYGATVTDDLPVAQGLAWTIDGGSGAEMCAIVDGVLTCDFGTIAAGETVDVHISSPTTVAGCQVIDNRAAAAFTNADPAEAGDQVEVICPDPTPDPVDPATATPTPSVSDLPSTGKGPGAATGTGLALLVAALLAVLAAVSGGYLRRERMS